MKKFLINILLPLFMSFSTFPLQSNEIVVLTAAIGTEYIDIAMPGILNKALYCKKYGYYFICGYDSLDPSRPAPWSKILYLLNLMENPNVKWIFWSDADSLIMNHRICLESFIDENYNIIIAEGLNSGEFFIKNCDWSKKLLQDVYSKTEYINHHQWENIALVDLINAHPELFEKIKQVPQRAFNSYSKETCIAYPQIGDVEYQYGDFIMHFAAIRGFQLKECMKNYEKMVMY